MSPPQSSSSKRLTLISVNTAHNKDFRNHAKEFMNSSEKELHYIIKTTLKQEHRIETTETEDTFRYWLVVKPTDFVDT